MNLLNKSKIALKKVNGKICILLVILSLGIFLRTYHFHDWLRFNADQGRDAEVVSAVVEGKESWPQLGPKAGGTEFKLGPAFYDFQILAAKIFGNQPDKMAYPDLATSLASIVLLYFFLKKYFDARISLALVAIFAVSAYAIRYARFAWNPNSTPFWTLLALYAIHEVIIKKNGRNQLLWAIVAGMAIGIGVQLHTTLLLFLPITTIIVFAYLLFKKNNVWKYFFVILAVAVFLNTQQIYHELTQRQENTKAFFAGIETKQKGENSLAENFLHTNITLAQITPNILGGYEISDTFKIKWKWNNKYRAKIVVFVLGALFVLGGLFLAVRYYKKEKDWDKKVFLAILAVYTAVAYLIFIKLAFELSVRFYLVLIFLPFMLLGFWLQFFKEKLKGHWVIVLLIVTMGLIFTNLFFVRRYFYQLASYATNGGTVEVITLKQSEEFAQFIAAHSEGVTEVYVSGNEKFLFKAYKPIKYLEERSGTKLSLLGKKQAEPNKFFYIARGNKKNALLTDPKYTVLQHKTYGKFTILLLEKKN